MHTLVCILRDKQIRHKNQFDFATVYIRETHKIKLLPHTHEYVLNNFTLQVYHLSLVTSVSSLSLPIYCRQCSLPPSHWWKHPQKILVGLASESQSSCDLLCETLLSFCHFHWLENLACLGSALHICAEGLWLHSQLCPHSPQVSS